MTTYPFKILFLLWNAIPIYMSLAGIIYNGYKLASSIAACFLLIWLVSTAGLFLRKKWGWFLALSAVVVIWILMLIQTIRRITFVIVNQSMEGPHGEGSPMAFILGFLSEQILFFIPMTTLLILAFIARHKIREEIHRH
jgi:hypothetical protein